MSLKKQIDDKLNQALKAKDKNNAQTPKRVLTVGFFKCGVVIRSDVFHCLGKKDVEWSTVGRKAP